MVLDWKQHGAFLGIFSFVILTQQERNRWEYVFVENGDYRSGQWRIHPPPFPQACVRPCARHEELSAKSTKMCLRQKRIILYQLITNNFLYER